MSGQPAAGEFPDIGLFARTQHEPDAIPPPQGNAVTYIPVRSFDPKESRLAGLRRLVTHVHAFPSLGVSIDGSCGRDNGPGVCLVQAGPGRFRCFTRGQLDGGGALALTRDGIVIGIVLDGIDRVTLRAHGQTVTADVVENVYAARLPVRPRDPVRIAPAPSACDRGVAPRLLDRVAVLRRPADPAMVLPLAARDVLDEWRWQLDAIVEDGARFWGGGDGVEFWAVPVVPRAAEGCAPATGVCIVAVLEAGQSDAHCVWRDEELRKGTWKLAPLWPDAAALFGIVPDGVTGERVTIDGQTGEVEADDNVVGGKLPFPYRDNAKIEVQPISRAPRESLLVGVVDATGADGVAANVRARIAKSGYRVAATIRVSPKPQPRTEVYWRPRLATLAHAQELAHELRALGPVRLDDRRLAPLPVLETPGAIVVVVGSER